MLVLLRHNSSTIGRYVGIHKSIMTGVVETEYFKCCRMTFLTRFPSNDIN